MVKTTFAWEDWDDNQWDQQWNELPGAHLELWDLQGDGDRERVDYVDTTHGSKVVLTGDGSIGLWIKLNPFKAAEWSQALQYVDCPVYDETDPDQWEYAANAEALHTMSLHWLASRLGQWRVPLRQAFLELGWDNDLLRGPNE